MAIVGGTDEEDLQKQNGKAAAPGGEGGYVGGAGGGGPTTKAGAPTSSGGGYTNLSSYLQANQGAGATTGRAAENVVDQSGRDATQAQYHYGSRAGQEIEDATSKAGVDQNTVGLIKAGGATVDQGVLDKIKGGVATADQQTIAQMRGGAVDKAPDTSYSGPMTAKANDYSGKAASNYYTSWAGPADTSHLGAKSTEAQQNAIAANDTVQKNAAAAQGGQAGVSGLLTQAYQQPSYTKGENNLDAFLANGTEGGRAALGQASGVAKNTTDAYGKLNDILTKNIGVGQQRVKDTNATYDSAYNDAVAQTGKVNDIYANAIAGAKADHTAADAYAAATKAGNEKNLAALKEQIATAAKQAELAAQIGGNDPGAAEGTGGGSSSRPSDFFQTPDKSKKNPLIPNPIPDPVPVVPDMPKPDPIQMNPGSISEALPEVLSPTKQYKSLKKRLGI